MKCATLLAQFPNPTEGQFWAFLIPLLFLGGIVLLALRIRNESRKGSAAGAEQRRVLPDPLRVRHIEDDDEYVTKNWVNKQLNDRVKKIEDDIEKTMEKHENYVHGRFHDVIEELNNVAIEAKNGREIATTQFQKIEGRLGELKATTEHINSAATQTNQQVQRLVENLPTTIASAINRTRR